MAPHGGIFVFPVVGNPFMYLVSLVVGTLVSFFMLVLLKKDVVE
jgi:PTS system fructose-specific IIC component